MFQKLPTQWRYRLRLCLLAVPAILMAGALLSLWIERIEFTPNAVALRGHTREVNCLAFDSRGELLFSGSNDGTIMVWNARSGKQLFSLWCDSPVVNLAFSSEGNHLASLSQGQDWMVRVWEPITGKELRSLKIGDGCYRGNFSPDGERFASLHSHEMPKGDGHGYAYLEEIKLWNLSSGRQTGSIKGFPSSLTSVAFSPDGRQIAGTHGSQQNGGVRIWDTETGKERLTFVGHGSGVHLLVFSPDGKSLAGAPCQYLPPLMWETTTGNEGRSFEGSAGFYAASLTFNSDGTLLASRNVHPGGLWRHGSVKIWDVATGKLLRTISSPLQDKSCRIAFSPDSKRLATDGANGTILVWDLTEGVTP